MDIIILNSILNLPELYLNEVEKEAFLGLLQNVGGLNKAGFEEILKDREFQPWVDTIQPKLKKILSFMDQCNHVGTQLVLWNQKISQFHFAIHKKEISGDDLVPLTILLLPANFTQWNKLQNKINLILDYVQNGEIAYYLTTLNGAINKYHEGNIIHDNKLLLHKNKIEIYFKLDKINNLCRNYIDELIIKIIKSINKLNKQQINSSIYENHQKMEFKKLYEVLIDLYEENKDIIEKNKEIFSLFSNFFIASELYASSYDLHGKNIFNLIESLHHKFIQLEISPENSMFAKIQKKSNNFIDYLAPTLFSSKTIFNFSSEKNFYRCLRDTLPELVDFFRQQNLSVEENLIEKMVNNKKNN